MGTSKKTKKQSKKSATDKVKKDKKTLPLKKKSLVKSKKEQPVKKKSKPKEAPAKKKKTASVKKRGNRKGSSPSNISQADKNAIVDANLIPNTQSITEQNQPTVDPLAVLHSMPYRDQLLHIGLLYNLPCTQTMTELEMEAIINAARAQMPEIPQPSREIKPLPQNPTIPPAAQQNNGVDLNIPYIDRLKQVANQFKVPYESHWSEGEIEAIINAARMRNPGIPSIEALKGLPPVVNPDIQGQNNSGSVVVNSSNIDQMINQAGAGGPGVLPTPEIKRKPGARAISNSGGANLPRGFQGAQNQNPVDTNKIDLNTVDGNMKNIDIIGRSLVTNIRGHWRLMTFPEIVSLYSKPKYPYTINVVPKPGDSEHLKLSIHYNGQDFLFPTEPSEWIKYQP